MASNTNTQAGQAVPVVEPVSVGPPAGYVLEVAPWSNGEFGIMGYPGPGVEGTPETYAEIVAESYGSPEGTDKALAHLFAAAPDMQAALEGLLAAEDELSGVENEYDALHERISNSEYREGDDDLEEVLEPALNAAFDRFHKATEAAKAALAKSRRGYIADWLAVALFGLLLAVFCCLGAVTGAGASELTWQGRDAHTGQAVEVLDWRYQCCADRAADAGSRAGIDCQVNAAKALTGDWQFARWADDTGCW